MDQGSDIVIVSCSILKIELEALADAGKIDIPRYYMESILHLRPGHLEKALTQTVERFIKKGKKVVVIYGDCFARMHSLCDNDQIARVPGKNCCELVLGSEEYRKEIIAGAFFLMPEWAVRWKEVFFNNLKIKKHVAKDMMNDLHKKCVYLDTGFVPIPTDAIESFAEYTGLPIEYREVSLDTFLDSIQNCVKQLRDHG